MSLWYTYFEIQTEQGRQPTRFRRHRIFRFVQVFQANCRPTNNCWNEPGYGWGRWTWVH